MHQLGQSDLTVSPLCLGTMTFGTQTDTADAHAQLNLAVENGINFVDTAEMYPVNPISAETVGRSESIVGEWLARGGNRNKVVLASKITGDNPGFVRDGAGIDARTLTEAVEGSLTRLQTDVIDLYQLHWPNRGSYHFRQNWLYDPTGQSRDEFVAHINEVLEAADRLIRAGKIRHIGLSNESAWGAAQWLRVSEERGLPRMQSIQNEYSLLCRGFDTDLAELAHNEQLDLLAFSPLATGLLTGKYSPDTTPEGSRRTIVPDLSGRITDRVWVQSRRTGRLRRSTACHRSALRSGSVSSDRSRARQFSVPPRLHNCASCSTPRTLRSTTTCWPTSTLPTAPTRCPTDRPPVSRHTGCTR